MKYEKMIQSILKEVGGQENIESVYHCATRLRFQLKDETKANDEAVKAIDGGSFYRKRRRPVSDRNRTVRSRRL